MLSDIRCASRSIERLARTHACGDRVAKKWRAGGGGAEKIQAASAHQRARRPLLSRTHEVALTASGYMRYAERPPPGFRDRRFTPMSIFLPEPLTPEELTALKVVAAAPPLRGLPYKIEKRLVNLGFAVTVRGGLIATEDGLLPS